jgi:ABC-type branched-subunit amino acid transport system substrate-binding protein
MSKNVFYTGAAPNQQAIPAVEYLMSKEGGGAKRFFLLGTDYVYPRTTNKILRAFLKSKGVKTRTSKRSTPRSVIATTRPSSPTSRSSRRVARPP